MKQELNLNCFDCNKSLQDCTCMEDTIDMKQESIKEVAEKLYPAEWDWKEKESFIEGAQWQADRMYTDMQEYAEFCIECDRARSLHLTEEEWFEQFKKK